MLKQHTFKLLAIALIFVFLATPGIALAQQTVGGTKTVTVTLAEQGFPSEDVVRGVRVTRDIDLFWPETWAPRDGNTFTLRFKHSPGLDPRSGLAVELNGNRVGFVEMGPDSVEAGELVVDLPAEMIEPGYNRVRLDFTMGYEDFNCEDLDEEYLWAAVRDTSTFRFSYADIVPEPDLAAFPIPLLDPSTLVDNEVTFILPNAPTSEELNAAVAVAAKLGQFADFRDVTINAITEADAANADNIVGDQIAVGRADRMSLTNEFNLPFDSVPADAGVLGMFPSPFDETTVIVFVTGATDEAVVKAGYALANEGAYERMPGSVGVALDLPMPGPSDVILGQVTSLERLGYADRTAYGTFEQRTTYQFNLPPAWQIQSEATFDLHFAHSDITDADESFLTVLLNDTPVGSIRLDDGNADEGRASFDLPGRLFEPGENTLSIASEMDLREGDTFDRYDCVDPNYDAAWLVIYSDSELSLPSRPSNAPLTLSDYPAAFIGAANLAEMAFVTPDGPDSITVDALLTIAERLGHFTGGEPLLVPTVTTHQRLSSLEVQPKYQILVGRPTDNVAISNLNDRLPQPFVPGSNDPQRVEGTLQIVPASGTVGYLQALVDAGGNPRLVVTGTNDTGLRWSANALSDTLILGELDGDLAIVSSEETVSTAIVKSDDERRPSREEPLPNEIPPPTNWVVWASIGFFVITLIILAVIIVPMVIRRMRSQ